MRRAVRFLLFVFAVAVLAAIAWGTVEGGRYLQHEDPLRKADAIFVLGGRRLWGRRAGLGRGVRAILH